MNKLIILQTLLVLHLTGLTVMAGTTVVEYFSFKEFAKLFNTDRERSRSIIGLMKKLSLLLGIGAALLIVSGVGLLIITNGVFVQQRWFQIKLLLVLALILNGFMVGGRQEAKLHKSIDTDDMQSAKAIRKLKIFYSVQMGIFFTIIFLSVFKFN
ncbi:MAG TPA: hypothetical protein VGM31_10925 [Puia sp.]|jgi:uncharacterized membrane protein SirB2